MPTNEHVALLGRGAAAWNAWRAEHGEVQDLSRGALRGIDLSGFDLSRADLRGADLRGTKCASTDLSGARLEGANLFKAVLDGADLAGAFLCGAQFLNCGRCSSPRTGNRPSVTTRCTAARPFRTGRRLAKPRGARLRRPPIGWLRALPVHLSGRTWLRSAAGRTG